MILLTIFLVNKGNRKRKERKRKKQRQEEIKRKRERENYSKIKRERREDRKHLERGERWKHGGKVKDKQNKTGPETNNKLKETLI